MQTTERRIGRYVLLEPLGWGAMGTVYRAEDPFIHRTVAVKVVHADRDLSPRMIRISRERFKREAEAAGRIDHPNIIRIFDVGEDHASGELYLVMEFVAGPSLESMLAGGGLALDRGLPVIGQLAAGLDAAHARGIIHRDIKPSNILFTKDGVAKIVDFGITLIGSSAQTQDMGALGTPAYMSPEQVHGHDIDARSDLFSLGVVSYEILAGKKPFEGKNAVSLAHAIAHAQARPISQANPSLSRTFDAVFERVLSKEPNARFASGREFNEALLGGVSSPAAVPKPRRIAFWGLGGLAALAAAIVLGLSLGEPTAPAAKTAAKASPAPPTKAPAKKAVPKPAPAPMTNVTISLAHRVPRGTLIVSLDGAPILTEQFSKPKLVFLQTTTWDPFRVPAGAHKVTAEVTAENGKSYLSGTYPVEFLRASGAALRISFKRDKLAIKFAAR